MAQQFDPSQWEVIGQSQQASAAAAPAAFDPSQWEEVPEMAAPAAKAPSVLEAFLRGGAQGATAGFSDELVGGVESLFTNKTYQQARDESRAANAAAKAANPYAFGAGEVGGTLATALVPGGAVARGAGFAAKVGVAAAQGAVSGLGYSEGQDAATIAKDTLAGGAMGAAGGAVFGAVGKGLAKLVAKSPERASKRIVQEIVSSASPKARDKLVGEGGKNAERIGKLVLEDADMLRAYRDPVKLQGVVKTKLSELGSKLDPIYDSVDLHSTGVDAADVWSTVEKAASKYKSQFRGGISDMLQKKADDLSSQIGSSKTLTAAQMRDVVSSFQDDAFAGSFVNPTAAKKAMRQVSGELREILNSHVEQVAGRANLGDAAGIRRINQRMADLINLRDVVERSATRAEGATKTSPFSLKNAQQLASNPLALLGLGAASPQLAIAAGGAQLAAKGARALDDSLAARVARGATPSAAALTQPAARLAASEGAAYVAQRRGTVADVAALAQSGASEEDVRAAAKEAGLSEAVASRLLAAFGGA